MSDTKNWGDTGEWREYAKTAKAEPPRPVVVPTGSLERPSRLSRPRSPRPPSLDRSRRNGLWRPVAR